MSARLSRPAAAVLAVALLAAPAAGYAKAAPAKAAAAPVEDIQAALSEQRYVDAGRMIDQALLSGAKDPRLIVLGGELSLARGRHAQALQAFKQARDYPEVRARALQGQGLALSLAGRSDEALGVLKEAVAADPSAWRAWNALGGEYDRRRDWTNAEAAYAQALAGSGGAAIVLNNRGFSSLLQGRLDASITDLVGALEKRPDLAVARTNLRLAMGLKGDYDRALAAGPQEDRAALLNNVGYAALLRGDQARAQALFNQALAAKGQFYSRAAYNLETASGLGVHATNAGSAADVGP